MAQCQVSGKKVMSGHRVSHSNIKTNRKFKPNVQKKRIFDIDSGKWVRLNVSTRTLRTLNKFSLSSLIKKIKS